MNQEGISNILHTIPGIARFASVVIGKSRDVGYKACTQRYFFCKCHAWLLTLLSDTAVDRLADLNNSRIRPTVLKCNARKW